MSQADEQPMTSDTTAYAALRVGDAERQAAIAALGDHWRAGRLDPAEHERRTTAAFSAATRGDLDALFADLPAAAPAPAAVDPRPSLVKAPRAGSGAADVEPATPGGPSWLARNRGAVSTMIPLLATLLFFVTKQWYFFLLIPIAYTLVGTVGGGDRGPGRDRRRDRHRDQ